MIMTPAFLVGSERSGTTLLRLMLDHHPRIAFFHEFEFAVDLMDDDGKWPKLANYYRYLEMDRTAYHAHVTIDRSLSYPDLVDSFLCQKRDRDNKELVGATVHRNFHRLTRLWPDAQFIHLVRDPRDVGQSVIQMGWAENLWTAVDRWIAAEQCWTTLAESLSPDRFVEIRYEDLIASPREQLSRICALMEIDYHTDMFGYAKTSTYDMPDPSNAQRWKSSLDDESIRLAEARLGPLLAARGYGASGLAPLTITPSMQRELAVQDRKYRRRKRIDRFGLALCTLDFIARQCRVSPLHRLCQKQFNRIAEQHLK